MGDLQKKIDLERMIEILKVMKQEDPNAVQEGMDILGKELKKMEDDLPPGWDMKDFKTIEIPPEHKGSLGATFKFLEDFAKKEEELEKLEEQIEKVRKYVESEYFKCDTRIEERQLYELVTRLNKLKESMGIEAPPQSVYDKDYAERLRKEFEKRLEERKKEYRASGKGIDFNRERTDEEEDERMQALSKIIGKTEPPSNDVAGVYLPSAYGADIEAEQVFQQELHGIVDEMKVKFVDEKKILEGTMNVEYGKGEWTLPEIVTAPETPNEIYDLFEKDTCVRSARKNELSNSNPVEEQWKSDSPNGSLITDLTPTSTHDSSSSSCTAEPSSPSFPTVTLRRQSTNSLTSSCSGKSEDCGIAIDATNESSECTVPMISAAMLGTPNAVRWSPPPRSMESLVPSLLGARS